MKKKIVLVLASSLILGTGFGVVSCSNEVPQEDETITLNITSSAKEVAIGKTLQLTVTGNEDKELTYSSSDTSVVTVNASGLVTGVKEGKATITVSLKEDSNVKASIEISVFKEEVLPAAIEISGFEKTDYIAGDKVTLTISATPSDATSTVTWATSDETIATVTSAGEVAFVGEGSVTISATSTAATNVKDEVEFTSKFIVDTELSKEVYDYSGLSNENPSFKTLEGKSGDTGLTTLNDVKGQYYVLETTVKAENPSGTDTWSRIGLGHIDPEKMNSFNIYCVSPGPNMTAKKGIMMQINQNEKTKGWDVQWGAITDRSQMWNFNGVNELDFNSVKLTAIRNGTDYYYFVNDKLYYKEVNTELYNGVDTAPVFHSFNLDAAFSDISYEVGEEAVKTYLSEHKEAEKTFYPTYDDYVSIDENNTIKFTGVDTAPTNNKDVAAKSIGDAFYLPAGKYAKVEFDFTIDKWGSKDPMPAVVFTLSRWSAAANESRSYVISEFAAGFSGWNMGSDMPAGIGSGTENGTYESPLKIGQTYHAVCERPLLGSGYDTVITVNGKKVNHNWDGGGYQGDMVGWFSVRNLDATISNITLTVEE